MALMLEKFTDADFAEYFSLVGNEQVMAMITERGLSESEARKDYEQLLENNRFHADYGCFKVSDTDRGFLGLGKLALEEAGSRHAELGYMLLPEFWGQGWGGKIAAQLLARANSEELDRLFAIIDPANQASRKILVKNGFEHQEFKDFDGLPGEVLQLRLKQA